MKKNISINISGIIFHIEEDGYEVLRKYLDSINKYFSAFDDSSEILADIESRIAEILLSKLSEGKQVVTADDIHSLMTTMGSVNDFKAAEEQDFPAGEARAEEKKAPTGKAAAEKKLFRDEKIKVLGGVCAGLAHYFNIDPVWPRIILALLFFASYGALLIAYIIFWIVIPASTTLEDEPSVKKMFRNTEKKVVGGVASGIASYFGADPTLIRVLFVLFAIFGGLGIVVYIIMWIALPEAKTITEKMQMQGEPVTLSNIESSVKRGLNEPPGEESALAKIVLFPFRLIAVVVDGLAKILGPVFLVIVDVLRIGIGIVIAMIGVCFILSLILGFGVAVGMFHFPSGTLLNEWYVTAPNFPIDAFRQTFPTSTVFFAFMVGFIPALMITLLGSSIISKRIVFNSYVGWSLFVLFFISVAFVSFNIPQMVMAFKEEGEHKVELRYEVEGTPVLRVSEAGLDDYDVTDLWIRGQEGGDIRLVERFGAQGNTRKVAAENAKMVTYNVTQEDSILVFDSNITFKPDAKFRAQRLDLELFIPYNRPFIIEEGMWRLIDNRSDYEYYPDSDADQTWIINEYGLLECKSCFERTTGMNKVSTTTDRFGLTGFNAVSITGLFDAHIEKGDTWAVDIDGPQGNSRAYRVYTDGETLVIDFDDDRRFFWQRDYSEDQEVSINITMPSMTDLTVKGAGKVNFRGFEEDEVTIRMTGAVSGNGEMDARNMNVDLTGASYLDLSGRGNFLEADIVGASGLRAYGYEVKHAIVEARGASTAKVYVTERLESTKGIASSISHRGNPEEIRERN
jgi:phage shock protein PspC (stress-responsive transcriptional regulator)